MCSRLITQVHAYNGRLNGDGDCQTTEKHELSGVFRVSSDERCRTNSVWVAARTHVRTPAIVLLAATVATAARHVASRNVSTAACPLTVS